MLDTFPVCGCHLAPGQFSTRIATVDTSDFRLFCLMDSIEYLTMDGILYRVPRLMWTDLASIPDALWSLLPPQGKDGSEYGLPAAFHDAAYRDKLIVWPAGSMPSGVPMPNDNTGWVKATLPKEKCDLLLREMMLACRVPEIIAETIYQAVRLGGQHAFNEDRA